MSPKDHDAWHVRIKYVLGTAGCWVGLGRDTLKKYSGYVWLVGLWEFAVRTRRIWGFEGRQYKRNVSLCSGEGW